MTAGQSVTIQHNGDTDFCHVNINHRFPCTSSHADHYPPKEFNTAKMRTLIDILNTVEGGTRIGVPKGYELRPQCPKCSHEQGGKIASLTNRAYDFLRKLNLPTYK